MKRANIFLLAIGVSLPVMAQPTPIPDTKFLTPAQCSQITKLSENEFYIRGTVTMGALTIGDQRVPRAAIIVNGINPFDVIQRSCFNGKPT
jgi:hypothetical protein